MEKEIKSPDFTTYCVKNVFFPEEIKNFETIDEAKEYKEEVKDSKRTIYREYTLNFYKDYLDRNNVMEFIYSDDNITIVSPLKEGYEVYLPEVSKEIGKNVWEYDNSFHYLDSDYQILDDLNLIKEKSITRKRCK